MTTSISPDLDLTPGIANITAFNTDPYNTWKLLLENAQNLQVKLLNAKKITKQKKD